MKKNKFIIFISAFLMSNYIFSMESLPQILEEDDTLKPYLHNVMSKSLYTCPKLFNSMESPRLYKQLNFEDAMNSIFGKEKWCPEEVKFNNKILEKIFQKYKPQYNENEIIFLSNMFHELGSLKYNDTKDYKYLEKSAILGHPTAQYEMFLINYKEGKQEQARNYLFCSASQGNLKSLMTLSKIYQGYWNIGISKNLEIAKALCKEASERGSEEASFVINVSDLTEGTFGSKINFQQGVINAQLLVKEKNSFAERFINSIMLSSSESLQESNSNITDEDLDFLRKNLNWKDQFDD